MSTSYKAFIFDLDGTLLDTLPDLVTLTNKALVKSGFEERSQEEILSYVGNGLKALMCQAVPSSATPEQVEEALQYWKNLYPKYGASLTKPYSGIPEVLAKLQEYDKKLAVLSNKFDAGTKQLIGDFFPQVFCPVYGESLEIPRKPDPQGLLRVINELGCKNSEAVYIGDSPNDELTARRAGCTGVCVSWGYHTKESLAQAGVPIVIDSPYEMLEYL